MWNLLEFDSHTALVNEKDEICTYAQLYRESEGLAEHIDGRCLVFSLCSNSMGSVLGYVAFLNHRIVPLMLDEHIDRSLLNGFLDTYHPYTQEAWPFLHRRTTYWNYGYVCRNGDS